MDLEIELNISRKFTCCTVQKYLNLIGLKKSQYLHAQSVASQVRVVGDDQERRKESS